MLAATLVLGVSLIAADAEAAKRMGGGKSLGTQRQAQVDKSPNASPAQNPGSAASAPAQSAAAAAPAAAAAQSKRSWMGPIAGIAAGLGLAALASHLGFGDELASMLMIGLAVMAVLAIVGFVMRKRAMAALGGAARTGGMNYATADGPRHGAPNSAAYDVSMPTGAATGTTNGTSGGGGGSMIGAGLHSSTNHIPADFDTATFERQAKVQFIRLQASYDAKNLDDIRDFTTPEMFAELKMDLVDSGSDVSHTEVLTIDARVIDVAEEAAQHVVTVRFTGSVRDAADPAPESFDELWHLTKPRHGSGGWILAGIQQVA
jgi:predicted lipid-binding transport protein (Tim44 family)